MRLCRTPCSSCKLPRKIFCELRCFGSPGHYLCLNGSSQRLTVWPTATATTLVFVPTNLHPRLPLLVFCLNCTMTDAEAAALESTLPSVTKPSQPSNLSAKKDRSVYDGPFVHGFKGTDVPVVCWATGATVETKALDPDVFGVPIRRDVVHDVIRWQLSKRRAGNAKVSDSARLAILAGGDMVI